MIVKKSWTKRLNGGLKQKYYVGWFLFGIIPIYIIVETQGW